jgi:1,3-beta-glucan synthase
MFRENSKSQNNSWIAYYRLSRTMITGYKRTRLGQPSPPLSSDVPRAGWRAVIFSEVLFPIAMAVILVIAYSFVKSFPVPGTRQTPALIRIAVVSLGPIVWNAAVLLALFIISLFLGPMLNSMFPKFGYVMAFIAHMLGVIGMIAFFEFLVCSSFLAYFRTNRGSTVVPRTMGRFACHSWSHRGYRHSAGSKQDPYRGFLV